MLVNCGSFLVFTVCTRVLCTRRTTNCNPGAVDGVCFHNDGERHDLAAGWGGGGKPFSTSLPFLDRVCIWAQQMSLRAQYLGVWYIRGREVLTFVWLDRKNLFELPKMMMTMTMIEERKVSVSLNSRSRWPRCLTVGCFVLAVLH
jgi:hypothetical protein